MNIFVAKLDFSTTSEDLRAAFEQFGEVESAKVIMDKFTGKSKGFGFVEMPNSDEAQNAIESLNQSEMGGRTIVVKDADTPDDNSRRSSGGARSGGGFRPRKNFSGGGGGGFRPRNTGYGGEGNYNSYGGGGSGRRNDYGNRNDSYNDRSGRNDRYDREDRYDRNDRYSDRDNRYNNDYNNDRY